MARKRRNFKKPAPDSIVSPRLIATLVTVCGVALVYLGLCGRCEALGARIKSLEMKKADAEKRMITEEYNWSKLKSPRTIEQLLKRFQIIMVRPDEARTVRIRVPEAASAPVVEASAANQFAQTDRMEAHD